MPQIAEQFGHHSGLHDFSLWSQTNTDNRLGDSEDGALLFSLTCELMTSSLVANRTLPFLIESGQ